jgi:hypothetical protein
VNTVISTPVLLGFQPVSALLLALDQRGWILAHWHLGFRLQRVESQHWRGFLLQFSAPLRCDTATLPGLALIAEQGRLYGAQTAPKGITSEAILLCQGGIWVGVAESELSAVDAADWLDLSEYPCLRVPVADLAPLQEVVLSTKAGRDTRAVLGGKFARPDPALQAFLKARQQGSSSGETGSKLGALASMSASLLGGVFSWLKGSGANSADNTDLDRSDTGSSDAGGNGWQRQASATAQSRQAGSSWGASLANMSASLLGAVFSWLKANNKSGAGQNTDSNGFDQSSAAQSSAAGGWWQRIASVLGVGKLLGMQHAAFLARMLRDLDSGNIDELLKRAIPLSDADSPNQPLDRMALMQSRPALTWTHHSNFGIGAGAEFMQQLAARYRQLFRQLDRAGRIEEAAFVLIELLRQTDEGIDYLLKHGEFAKAAELAEARAQAPARIVRLWLLAGVRERAFRFARWSKCYAAALQMLADQPELVHALRCEWAENLAAAHQYPEAVQALWPLVTERARCLRWIEAAKANASQRAAMLCCELQLEPERLPKLNGEIESMLADASENAAEQRHEMARTLLRERVNQATQRLLVPLIRALLSDMSCGRLSPDAGLIQQLEKHASEPFWNADRARGTLSQARVDLLARTELLRLEAGAQGEPSDAMQHIFDAIQLAQGRCLVALGDAGVVLVDQNGRRLHYFKTPAHKLIADRAGGLRVIALAKRAAQRVDLAVLDLPRKLALTWCSTRLDCFAPEFDGQHWAVAVDRSMLLIELPNFASEATSFPFQANWHVGDLPGPVCALDWSTEALQLICQDPSGPCTFEYRWPGLTLARRYLLNGAPTAPMFAGTGPAALVYNTQMHQTLAANSRSSTSLAEQIWLAKPTLELHHYGSSKIPITLALTDIPQQFQRHSNFATRTWLAQQFCGTDKAGKLSSISLIYPAYAGKPILQILASGTPPVLFGDAEHVFCAQGQHLLRVSIANSKVLRLML